MFSRLYRGAVLAPFERIKGRNTYGYWAELERSQWLPRAELERRQVGSLRRLLAHAYEHSPHYRREWQRAGLDPRRVHSLADFLAWPVTSRQTILAHRVEMRSAAPGSRTWGKATGGSTGVPLQFDITLDSWERRTAASYRGFAWAGALPGMKQTYLWGVPVGEQTWRASLKDRLYNRLHRRLLLNTFELSRETIPVYLRRHNRYRPEVVVAYAGALYAFARGLEERGLVPHAPRAIVVGAEKIHPFMRELIERVFRAPVFETYGSREFMLMGAECPRHSGLHLTTENHVLEVLDDDGRPTPPGEEGNVAVTDLTNYGMPFVRYLNGDRAVAGFQECPCGRGLPLLRSVSGRRADVIETPDGRMLSGLFFPHLFKEFPAVERFQVVQEAPDHVQIRMILRPQWRDSDRRLLAAEVGKVLGPAVRVELLPVDDIPLSVTGKHCVVVRKSAAPADAPALRA